MDKKFALQPAKALKKLKVLAAKNEFTNKLDFSVLAICCEGGPVIDFSAPAFTR